MLDGNGPTQQFLRRSYLNARRKALKDKSGYTEEELDRLHLDIKNGEGSGRTNPETTDMWMTPYPTNPSVRSKKKTNIRELPWIGW